MEKISANIKLAAPPPKPASIEASTSVTFDAPDQIICSLPLTNLGESVHVRGVAAGTKGGEKDAANRFQNFKLPTAFHTLLGRKLTLF